MDIDYVKVGERVREKRKTDSFTQAQLAEAVDLSTDYICEIVITEGRYHEIKRMFEAVDCKVEYLKRYSMGKLELDMSLRPGEYKEISRAECGID